LRATSARLLSQYREAIAAKNQAVFRENAIVSLSTSCISLVGTFRFAIFGSCACLATAVGADQETLSPDNIDQIVVTAKKQPNPVADEEMREQVQTALHSDPFFYDEHVTVTIKNGVITLHGIVFDYSDLQNAIRIAKRVPGAKRVFTDLEIVVGNEDDY
jgi:osmotically-inducible protein OsmY